ncbi:hypothetical protein N7463_006265 [Penicillium fimorum]|uniref:Uncharacterized protein n=1 Tax=Penicillium fimorum TaxID=1882269 RepID=A0A9X0C6G7_9EURO|nr:hypothetical protein N7463_006265 [Penicillium fimorum]
MEGIVNRRLSLFRKSDSTKPLHTRWGDVSISVPTDGSWNQYDNPHLPVKERPSYGPGYVPDCSPQDRNPHPVKEDDQDDDDKSVCSEVSTSSRRSSSSFGGLRPGRISVRLPSRPKQPRGESQIERDAQRSEQKRNDFAYRPIQQDYTSELVENTTHPSHRFKYIPTNGRYLESSGAETPRSRSVSSPRSPHWRRSSVPESSDRRYSGRGRNRDHYTPNVRVSTYHEDDRRSSLYSTSIGDISDSSGSPRNYGPPPRRRTSPFVAADRRASTISRPLTMVMVPDPDNLYE